MRIVVQEEPFDAGQELNSFNAAQSGMGAVVSFSGLVRDLPDDPLDVMEIEHYSGMTEKALAQMAQEAIARWELGDALIIHRYGRLEAGETIMMVACASKHRKNAFEAADFLMDFLKSRAPFWKKEKTTTSSEWVASKQDDEDALKRW